MAVKSNFTDGTALPASDINTYLTNGGLVYVTSQTVGTAVASVTVTGAFSSTYDNYKIIYTAGVGTGVMSMRLGASVTTYSNSLIYGNTYGTPTASGIGSNNAANWSFIGYVDANVCSFGIDLFGPNLARYTTYAGTYVSPSNAGSSSGIHATATAYTDFTLVPNTTFTGGTITVYGYRKA
jgi:hypothetical protein